MSSAETTTPRHIAVIMDGNGRWARRRGQPRTAGHRAGVRATRSLVENSMRAGVPYLTVFAFSSENWSRPASEVGILMDLFMRALDREVAELHDNGVAIRFIGEHARLADDLRKRMAAAEAKTAGNTRMQLAIAVGYGGRNDLTRAVRRVATDVASGRLHAETLTDDDWAGYRDLADWPEPDLFIRTGGEYRISNFLLWDLAYTELYFCDTLWPDFDADTLNDAIAWFGQRERRFGGVTEATV